MRITQRIYMVGSGQVGLSHATDGHIYLLDAGRQLILVDAGAGQDPTRIIQNIREEGLNERAVAYLLLTHSHADHAGGAKALKALTGAEIICSEVEAGLLTSGSDEELGLDRARRSGIYPPDYVYDHIEADVRVRSGQELRIGALVIRAIEVPGHSLGSICYLVEDGGYRMLFSGDTVFHGGTIGLGNWAGSSLEDYRRYIGRLAGLGVEALLPGHFLWTLRDGQAHLDKAIENLEQAWVPPAWQHQHPLR